MENENKGLKIIMISLIIIIIILIIAIVIALLMKNKNNTNKIDSLYTEKAIATMKDIEIYDKVLEYSKTVEVMLENNKLKKEYLNKYFDIDYIETKDFTTLINTLLDKNYSIEEINYITSNYKDNINILLNMDYINILQFQNIKNFDISKVNRYLDYHEKNNYDLATSVTYVNIGLDLKGYSTYTSYTLEEATDISILVNKYHKLPDDYEKKQLKHLRN